MKLLYVLLIAASLSAADPKPPSAIPVSPQDMQALKASQDEVNRAVKSLQDLGEIVRLRSCLAAGVTLAECGQWDQSGVIVRLPKPETKPAPKPEAKPAETPAK
jgi:hypothetical protein